MIGLQLEAQPVNGRRHVSSWSTVGVQGAVPARPTKAFTVDTWVGELPGTPSVSLGVQSEPFAIPAGITTHTIDFDFRLRPRDYAADDVTQRRLIASGTSGLDWNLAVEADTGHLTFAATTDGTGATREFLTTSVPLPEALTHERVQVRVIWDTTAGTVTFRSGPTLAPLGTALSMTSGFDGTGDKRLGVRSTGSGASQGADIVVHSVTWEGDGTLLADLDFNESNGARSWVGSDGHAYTEVGTGYTVTVHRDRRHADALVNPKAIASAADGTVTVEGANGVDGLGDWLMVERARTADLLLDADDPDSRIVLASNAGPDGYSGWRSPLNVVVTPPRQRIHVEWWGAIWDWAPPTGTNLFGLTSTCRVTQIADSGRIGLLSLIHI